MTEYNQILTLLALIFLISLSALFSSAETAFTTIGRIKLRSLLEKKVKGIQTLNKILQKPRTLVTAILIGNNIVNIAASAIATNWMIIMLHNIGIENIAAGLSITTGIMTFLILTFGEITPKALALKNPTKWAILISPFMYYFIIAVSPVIAIFDGIHWILSKIFGFSISETRVLTEGEIKSVIKLAEEDGILQSSEKHMLNGVLNFTDKVVREVMTPRTDTLCVEVNASLEEVINLFKKSGHSRIPVYEDNIDNILGIIYAKDLLVIEPEERHQKRIQKYMRKAEFIPESKDLRELLQQMKLSKFHIAIAIDEYGGMAGIVTFEDIIEEIVGDVLDEYDNEPGTIIAVADQHYLVDAGLNMDDLPETIQAILPKEDEDYDTIGGFVLSELGALPQKGDILTYKNLEITVGEIRKRRIISLEIKILESESQSERD